MRAHAGMAKNSFSAVPFHPSEWPLLSAPWCSQMPVTSPWKDKREGEPDGETGGLRGVADPEEALQA